MDRAARVVDAVGLGRPARAVWRRVEPLLRRNGLREWEPLVPTAEFTATVEAAVRDLASRCDPSHPFVYLEFGVSRGTSMACVAGVLRSRGVPARIVGFDSFEGLPPEAAGEGWRPGEYRSTSWATRRYLRRNGVDVRSVELVEGWFEDTLTEDTRERLAIGGVDLIMVDCDIYSASKRALEFALPLVRERAVVMFDDWGWREDEGQIGQKEAFAEVMADHPELAADPRPSYLPQARVFDLARRG